MQSSTAVRAVVMVLVATAFTGAGCAPALESAASIGPHDRTVWSFEPSVAYDALSFINGLSGDPFYAPYYGNSVRRFDARLSGPARRSLARLARRKQRYGFIYSAFTTMFASTRSPATLDELADYFCRPGDVMRAYRRTEHHRPVHGGLFRVAVARDSVRVLRALDGETVQVYVLAFGQPHAVKLAGNRLLVDLSYSDEIIAQNAIHESMHPPVDWSDPDMRALLDRLDGSPFVRRAFDEHDPAFGYNQFEGYVEESIVRVLDQRIAEERLVTLWERGTDVHGGDG